MASGIELLTLRELAFQTSLAEEDLRALLDEGVIAPARTEPELLFEVTVVLRVHKLQRLRRDLEIEHADLGLVLELLDRIEELERRLRLLDSPPA